MMNISQLQQQIINRYQKGFPLNQQPYLTMAQDLNVEEADIIAAMTELQQANVLSRVGPVFDHKKAGASTLAAVAATPETIDDVAEIINQFEQVNHNYAREHEFNLWFVVTAADPISLNQTLTEIQLATGLPVLVLPMEASYHIDLSFDIDFSSPSDAQSAVNIQFKGAHYVS